MRFQLLIYLRLCVLWVHLARLFHGRNPRSVDNCHLRLQMTLRDHQSPAVIKSRNATSLEPLIYSGLTLSRKRFSLFHSQPVRILIRKHALTIESYAVHQFKMFRNTLSLKHRIDMPPQMPDDFPEPAKVTTL